MTILESVEFDLNGLFFLIHRERVNPDAGDIGGVIVEVLLNIMKGSYAIRIIRDRVSRITKKLPRSSTPRRLEEMPGSDLLSHGETPYYHRRWTFSLPSSEWNRVGPVRYGRQAKKAARPDYGARHKNCSMYYLLNVGNASV